MPTNKNAFIRYKTLDKCFRNSGKRYFIDDLIDECNKILIEIDPNSKGISRRQIFDDIAFMERSEGWGINLIRHRAGKKVFYRYEDLSFSINNMPLNEVEVSQLKGAMETLSQFKGMPQFDWIADLIPKLNQGIIPKDQTPLMAFEDNEFLKGKEFVGELYQAIRFQKVMKIIYQPFESIDPYEFIFHPYFLKQYNNRWFVFGYNPAVDKYDWVLALDRISTLEEINQLYVKNTKIDWTEYFEEIVGVTKPENISPISIKIHFYGRTGYYIVTKPIHGSQKSRWLTEGVLEIRIELIPNYEFERLILSYADTAKVIEPENLRERIMKRLMDGFSQY